MTFVPVRVPERVKKSGVHYAVTDDGLELPVVDLTHPAFQFDVPAEALEAHMAAYLAETRAREKIPKPIAKLLLRVVLRKSTLARGLREAEEGTLGGLHTYLFKVGPELLGAGYTAPIDRKIAAALPSVSMRLRLLDMARFLAEGLAPRLAGRAAPLHLVTIGGGPSPDCWNALLLLQRDQSERLRGRRVVIHALDLDRAGPSFGARALQALRDPGGPLHGLDATFERTPYDWREPGALREIFAALSVEQPIVALSSEGALFEYADDAVVRANLDVLREVTPPDAFMVGSVTDDGEVARLLQASSPVKLQPRSREAFASLAAGAGWRIERELRRPVCRDVLLVKSIAEDSQNSDPRETPGSPEPSHR